MAYREPAVRVTQEFVNALPALAAFALPNVNIGPAYQVVTKKLAGAYAASAANYSYPEQLLGTFVDLRTADATDLTSFPVRIYMRNTTIRIINQTGVGAVNPYDLNQFTDATSNIFQNVRPGDVIVVTGSVMGNNGSFTIREKLSNNLVQTNETFAAVESGLNYSIRRNIQADVGDVEIPRTTLGVTVESTQVTLPSGLTYVDTVFGTVPIISASVYLSYRALRVDKSSDVFEYTATTELQADFGTDQIVPENPVVFAAFIALTTAPGFPTNLLALPQDYLIPDPGNELIAYQKALEIVALEDIYAISVLTHNTSVHTSLKQHCELFSLPDQKLERVGIVNRRLVTTAVVVDDVTTSGLEGITGPSGGPFTTLNSSASAFLTDGVVPGHFIVVTTPSNVAGRYEVGAVVSQTQITLVAPGAPNSATGVTFYVERDLQKTEQAQIMSAYADSLGSRRMVMTWPDIVRGPVGPDIKELPGYFLNSVVGALTTGLPTQQGLTNLNIPFFTGVVHSSKYFSGAQLNTLAEGGVMIFAQDVLNVTALYVRHQLTTDTSAIKFQEYSITKNVDFIAKFIRTNHRQFIGQYNIVDTTFDDLKANAKGILTFLRDNTRLPKIGGVIRSGNLILIEQDPANIDTIRERYALSIPIPLNNLDITIVV